MSHFATYCLSGRKKIHALDKEEETDATEFYAETIAVDSIGEKYWMSSVQVQSRKIEMKLDTGV